MKEFKPSEKEQKIVAKILTEFMFVNDMDEVWQVWKDIYKRYELCEDPFTYTPCTPKEYSENRLEYDRQIMMEMYGHYDGLD